MGKSAVQFWSDGALKYDEKVDYIYGKNLHSVMVSRLSAEKGLGKVAEFGCGTGYFTPALAREAESVLATDFAEGMVRVAGERLKGMKNVSVTKVDCLKTGLPDESFDTAFLGGVIHLIDGPTALKEMYRILKPGGTLLIILPLAIGGPLSILRSVYRYFRTAGLGAPTAKVYSESSLRATIEKAGFQIASVETLASPEDGLNMGAIYVKATKK